MAIVDDRGRVFGRVNLVDAVLIAVLLGLVPLAYGAYALFRTPPPVLLSVSPATLKAGPNLRVTIHGENLRPYMRVSFNDKQGRTFLFGSPTSAEVELGDLSPGTYDVVLYDYAQERARLPKALTIAPPPLPSTAVVLVGMLANLPEGIAKQIVKGMKLADYGQALDAGHLVPEMTRIHAGTSVIDIPVANVYRVPLSFRMPCYVQMVDQQPVCIGAGIVLTPGAFVLVQTPIGIYPFQISQVLGVEPLEPVDAVVRLEGAPSALALVKAGDVDLGASMNELAAGARVVEVSPPHVVSAVENVAAAEATLRLQAQQGLDGWRYAGGPLRVGAAFALRTRGYEFHGTVLKIAPERTVAAAR